MTRIVPDQFFFVGLLDNTPDFNQSLNFLFRDTTFHLALVNCLFHVLEAVGSRI